MNKQILILLVMGLMIFPLVSADVITPTMTKVYFEQSGQAYNSKIDFTVKGYGYSYPVGPFVEKAEGTYAPKVVFSFSATYNNYGNEIYENYYMNYRHIDYYEVEGKTADGKTFIIKNLDDFLSNCNFTNPEDDPEYQACISNLVRPNFVDPSKQPTGTVRQDYLGRNWTKGSDGMWTSPSASGTSWGDIIWAETDKDVYAYNEAKKKCDNILDEKMSSENYYERKCEIRLNLDNAEWENSIPNPSKGFWGSISCFFKRIFGKSC